LAEANKKAKPTIILEAWLFNDLTLFSFYPTLVDATLCSLEWELGDMPVRLNTVLAADIVTASMLGYRIDESSTSSWQLKLTWDQLTSKKLRL
jgi:hypothetical protein